LVVLLLQVAHQEQIDAVRAELVAKSGGDAEAAFEAERARVGDEKRAELEAQLAAAAAEAEAAAAAAEVRVHMGVATMHLPVGQATV
jgi:phage protein D